jgi:hypothetical protein
VAVKGTNYISVADSQNKKYIFVRRREDKLYFCRGKEEKRCFCGK